jgi:hypothetical protein
MPEPQQLHVNVRFEDEAFWATVDEFPGVFATGDNLDELRGSLEEGSRSSWPPRARLRRRSGLVRYAMSQ